MNVEDAQVIFLPIVCIITAIIIALAIGYFFKAGKTKQAGIYMGVFIAVALLLFLAAMLIFYGVYGKLG
jgi:uncharacterized membrane protein YwzB